MSNFNVLVEKIKKLALDEKEELHLLLEKYLIEARRDEIHTHFEKRKVEYKTNKAKFSSNLNTLKKSL